MRGISHLQCAGCKDAPEHHPGDADNTFYCSSTCQKEHRASHKTHCKALLQRKKLLRAAVVLKAAFLGYRETVYDVDLVSIELRDGTLHLHQRTRSAHREAALAHNQCTAAMALLDRVTRKLLTDVPATLEILDLYFGKPSMPTRLTPSPDWANCPHTVIKVGLLFGQGTWVLDTAGCQYGFRSVLVPYAEYIADNDFRIVNEPTTYSATETKDIDYFLTLPFMTKFKAQRISLDAERRSRLHFASFVDSYVEKDILDRSPAEFRDKLEAFKATLRLHMSK
ncbi:hypothetical protein BDW62DRAFT_202715 [Aspergillus aurantiobrunneus]